MNTRQARAVDERGSTLIMALIFLTVCGVTIGGLLTFSNVNGTATSAVRVARGTDYDADAAMNAAIATLRVSGATCGTGASGFTPTWTLNNTGASNALRVDCYTTSTSATQRDLVLSVCKTATLSPSTQACPDSLSLLRANVIFYDTPSFGNSIDIETWSDQ